MGGKKKMTEEDKALFEAVHKQDKKGINKALDDGANISRAKRYIPRRWRWWTWEYYLEVWRNRNNRR